MNEDRPRPGRDALVGLLLLALALGAYHAVWQAGFIWDDDGHVTRPDLRTLQGLGRIWFKPGATQQYYPLLHSAFWAEHRLWGDHPAPYHLLNIALHAGVGFLLYRLLRRLDLPGALLAAAAFTLHPVAVESVAWVSEQKNTLSGLFALGAALVYLRYDRGRRPGAYAAATLLFVLALATKTVTATLPAALLVIFWWQRGRLAWKADVRPLLPWLVLGAAAGMVTAWVEHTYIGATGTAFHLTPVERTLIAGRALWFYLGKLLWPHPLIFMYPHWSIEAGAAWQYVFPAAALGALTVAYVLRRRSRGPLAATLLFAGTLFPALGFINVFPFIYSYVADHFQYLASAVVISAGAATLTAAAGRLPPPARRTAAGLAVLVIAALGVVSARQARAYVSAQILWQDTLAKNPRCWMAYQNLGGVYLKADRPDLALPQFKHALEINPDDTEALNELGVAELHAGDVPQAVAHLRRALALAPARPETHLNLGVALLQEGDPESAAEFARALELDPRSVGALKNMAMVEERARRWPEAARYFQRAADLEPGNAETRAGLGAALLNTGDLPAAARELTASLALRADVAPVHFNLGAALAQEGKYAEAETEFQQALTLDPQLEAALTNLAGIRMRRGDASGAADYLRRAVVLDPRNAPLRNNLGIALAQAGRLPEAAAEFQRALADDPDFGAARSNLAAARRQLGRH